MLIPQVPSFFSSLRKEVYNPKAFFPHARLLRQAFAHCGKFPTAAPRRSRVRVSVPVWGAAVRLATGARVSNAYAIYLQERDSPGKLGLIPHSLVSASKCFGA